MISLSRDTQWLSFEVYGTPGPADLEYTIHAEGGATRSQDTSRVTSVTALTSRSGRLPAAAATDVLQGPNIAKAGPIVIQTITLYNPNATEAEAAVLVREDDTTQTPALVVRNTLWRFVLKGQETFSYIPGSGPSIDPPSAAAGTTSPSGYGVLTGSTGGRPVLVTSVTGVATQILHTVGATSERVTVQASANVAGPTALQLWIGGTAVGDGFEGTVGDRGPMTLLDRAVLESGTVVRVSAATASVVTVIGGFETVVAP